MAEQQTAFEFSAVDSKDLLAERQRGWESFTRFATWSIGLIAVVLILMAIFLG